MLFRNCTLAQLEAAARATGVRLVNVRPDGRGTRCTLGLVPSVMGSRVEWQRRSHQGRRVNAVCWHGHAAFMARLFLAAPDATIRGGRGAEWTYRGRNGFLDRFDATGDVNIGSYVQPMAYRDACDCTESDLATQESLVDLLYDANR